MLTSIIQEALLGAYLMVLLVVCVYGLHRYYLVYLYYKHKHNIPKVNACFLEWPAVTIQLPMFNERFVARRVIERACAIDYPPDKLHIQVLDDSTDETTEIARQTVERMAHQGHHVVLLHRNQREGYKAGALQEGMETAKGEFLCIFDADFIPPPQVLQETVPLFTDPKVGMVQVLWGHLNRDQSVLTKIQAILLDGHFVMEHGARNRSGRFMSFNGTAGIWRKSCIVDAGGWQHDTLTEDLDLSYRAQLCGWKFLFLPSTEVPAELPPEMEAFKAQQYRWTKGGAQTCRKLLPTILRSKWSWRIKLEAYFHLTSHVVYPFVVLLTILLFPALYCKLHVFQNAMLERILFDASVILLATCSFSYFYFCSQRELNKSRWQSIKSLPALMSLGVGIAINNARAMLSGLFGKPTEFVRTPKYGIESDGAGLPRRARAYAVKRDFHVQPLIELAMGLYMLSCLLICISIQSIWLVVPFLTLFAAGYLYVSLSTLLGPWWRHKASGRALPVASAL